MVNHENPYNRKLKVWAWVAILFSATQSLTSAFVSWHIFALGNRIPRYSIPVVQVVFIITVLGHMVIALWGAYLIVRMVTRSYKVTGVIWKRSAVKYSAILLITMLLHIYFCYYLRVVDYAF
jgi:hypothetical protein